MIKFLFKAIILPILIILSFPLILLGLMYKPMDNPLLELDGDNTITLQEDLEASFNAFLASETFDEPVVFALTDEDINGLLVSVFQEMNAAFLDTEDYVIREEYFGFSGAWVTFNEGEIELQAKLDIFVPIGDNPFVFQTGVEVVLKPTISLEAITIEVESVSIGNLPILWMFDLAAWGLGLALDIDIDEMINSFLEGFGGFNEEDKSITINIQNLIETQLPINEDAKALVSEMITFVSAASLIEIDTQDSQIEVSIAMNLLTTDIEPFVLEEDDRIVTSDDFQTLFTSLFDPYAIAGSMIEASLLGVPFTPYVDINELMLNQLIDYTIQDMIFEGSLVSTETGNYQVEVLAPFMRNLAIHVPFRITNTLTFDAFTSYVIVGTSYELIESDLHIQLTSVTLGTLELDDTLLNSILDNVPTNDMISGNAIVISDLDTLFGSAGISLQAIESYDNYIRVLVTANETLDFTVVEDLVDDILTTFTENPNIPASVAEATQDVLDAVLAGDSEAVQAQVENLIETFETLTEEEQAILAAEIEALIANSDIDFNDLFNFGS